MKIKTSETTPIQLDWLVAKIEGRPALHDFGKIIPWTKELAPADSRGKRFTPSSDWAQGGPIIEREKLDLHWMDNFEAWAAAKGEGIVAINGYGPTPLIAAMRCYVASELGNEVEVPDELC